MGKDKTIFNQSYVKYWRKRTNKSLDGAKVAGDAIAAHYIRQMRIRPSDKVLDLGCGYGRLFDVINKFSRNIIGLDISSGMLSEAAQRPYLCLLRGRAENTHLADTSVEKLVTWGTFDVVEQTPALVEANRILKKGGILLITGKNKNYRDDDYKAFVAERNAKLKDFPNHFTDVRGLIKNSAALGFKVLKAYAFPMRGDFGENRNIVLKSRSIRKFYEYLLLLKKIGPVLNKNLKLSDEYSDNAKIYAQKNGFANDVHAFIKWHKNSDFYKQ